MDESPNYRIDMTVRFQHGEVVDTAALVAAADGEWTNVSLCRVNDSVVRLGTFEGSFHWHHHDREDEYFQVLSGRLLVDLEDGTRELGPGQGLLVSRGIRHRTRAPVPTAVLMIEGATVVPTGDGGAEGTATPR